MTSENDTTLAGSAAGGSSSTPAQAVPAQRRLDWRRLKGRGSTVALTASALAGLGQALGTKVAGWLAEGPTLRLVLVLAACVVGAALLDTLGRTLWSVAVDRAEGRLRADLLDAVMDQPVSELSEQAVGEVLDRVDDDTHELGALLRQNAWAVIRVLLSTLPLLVVAGWTWWPAWLLLPVTAGSVTLAIRPLLAKMSAAKVVEEMAWTDHAAAMEEGVAARDDLRTALGQSYLVRRCAELSSAVHARFANVVRLESQISRRAGVILHGVLAAVAVIGVFLVLNGTESTATLVTLFLVTTTFVGQVDQVARHVPDLQGGVGALVRLRGLLAAAPEPQGGAPVRDVVPELELRHLHFAYAEGTFALQDVNLTVPAGQTLALVGRSGSGKSTLASLLSRAVEPEPGSVLLDGVDVRDLDLQNLRRAVGVVTQRTEILAGTLAENIALFADMPLSRVQAAVDELSLTDWVAGLPDGLETMLGPSGTTLSAGEEQLVAFARLLVRDVHVVVLDEATARMDPVTEARVVAASHRLLSGRTGILVAHRLTTTARADLVAVMDAGRVVQFGRRAALAEAAGPFRRLLEAAEDVPGATAASVAADAAQSGVGTARRAGQAPPAPQVPPGPGLVRGIWHALTIHPSWGLVSVALFLASALMGAYGAITGWLWGHLVVDLQAGGRPTGLLLAMVVSLLVAPLLLAEAIGRYPRWWVAVMLRARTAVLLGQTAQRRLERTPPGEVVARAMDADRFARYGDRWVDFANGLAIVVVTGIAGSSLLAGGVLLGVMVASAAVSALGSPAAGRSAAEASAARARFGRSLVSALESIRTVKLAAATPAVHAHLRRVDGGRIDAAVHEHRIQAMLAGVPVVLVQIGVVTAWAVHLAGGWGLATALLVSGAVNGFDWFGRVAGAVITEAPGTRAWQRATTEYAGGRDLMQLPQGLDLVSGASPAPPQPADDRLEHLRLRGLTAVHDDGTIGASDVDLEVRRGELVLLLGQIGSGKSSLLSSLAGLVSYRGELHWNGEPVTDPEAFLRPGRVAHVAQVPRVLSGTFADNIRLDHDREVERSIADARLGRDVDDAGGPHSLVGHRGVRLSGGQVQRLALARALAADAELLLADDVSSALDATTEVELWDSLRRRGSTVIGATTKRAALARADRVVVLAEGQVAAVGPWRELESGWGHLAG
ncbi:ABC transporter ATP-binding protein [Angustibacter sp. Root456]|uniref:ATP-binding cassette domain-containing protein n=1 Tax=Angustibacter sp. Root456 TaxID=1736539 RepID=UPI0006FEC980|nr:ABC transporter ATP-binding protein [Angustibacter sp. Root456]KQX69446.1 ABC transporter [Angustibacter sp. Root456]